MKDTLLSYDTAMLVNSDFLLGFSVGATCVVVLVVGLLVIEERRWRKRNGPTEKQ